MKAETVSIVEVGPRDGLQNEATQLNLSDRFELIENLARAGVRRIEVGAFVSPKWVPQMVGSGELIQKLFSEIDKYPKGTRFSALVPNARGMDDAVKTPIREVAVFGACSEGFSKKNINCTIAESLDRFREVAKMARPRKIRIRGYLSTAFGCPYDGYVDPSDVVRLSKEMFKIGVYELSVGDTIGVATPRQVVDLLKKLKKALPIGKIAMHFHDTRGTALANVVASLGQGVRVFDSSVGGLGGCPYAKGSSGNLATEDLIYLLEGMGFKTGIDLAQLIAMKPKLDQLLGRKLPSKVASAGVPFGHPIWQKKVRTTL